MKILVAFDKTLSALKGLKYALTHFPDAEFLVLYVERVSYVDGAYGISPLSYDSDASQEILASAQAVCAEFQVTPIVKSDFGSPAEVIVSAAEEQKVDLLVMGAHNKGTIERFLLGSVSESVARRAHCSVLIVR